ncbi:hypothetical protein Ga0080574_TMP4520 [Salipiger abyssi]|uniref:Uncharacterized protein n=1 Tax=Salipiger abyssi TaxID=1250539 RepID=A0A1P8UZM7_9RHOB|nr:hypothetical protein Ga0080574_TMP4520 [Salipiger abyssi]
MYDPDAAAFTGNRGQRSITARFGRKKSCREAAGMAALRSIRKQ